MRILVPYFLISIPFYMIFCFLGDLDFYGFLKQISTYSYWTEHIGAWYVAMLVPLYLFTPLLKRTIDSIKYRWLACVFIIASMILFGPEDLDVRHYDKTSILDNFYFVLIRIPSFIIGLWMAPHILRSKRLDLLGTIFVIIIVVALLKFLKIGTFYSWIIMPIAVSVVVILFINLFKLNYFASLKSFCRFMGEISLESYLTNMFLIALVQTITLNTPLNNLMLYIIIVILGTLLSFVAYVLSKNLISILQN